MNNVVDMLPKLIWLLVFCALLTACGEQEKIQQVDPSIRIDTAILEGHETIGHNALLPENFYFIGVGLQYKTTDAIKKHRALLAHLEKATGFQFKLLYSAKGQNAAEMLGDDQVQFAMVDAIGLVFAAKEYGAEPLARELTLEKRTVFVVKNDSPIRSLKAINKESLALSVKGSLEGDLKPRVMLKQAGFLLADIKGAYYAESPAKCIEDVINGEVSICALEERLVAADLANGTLRVL
ncbi:MAG: PhnD/SsuA/transferrin family substrate-binding protein, partial [Gammaproteobacteria bacterium]